MHHPPALTPSLTTSASQTSQISRCFVPHAHVRRIVMRAVCVADCNYCRGRDSLFPTSAARRLEESPVAVAPDKRASIRVRVDAYMGAGITKQEAWQLVRKENDALLANGTGI